MLTSSPLFIVVIIVAISTRSLSLPNRLDLDLVLEEMRDAGDAQVSLLVDTGACVEPTRPDEAVFLGPAGVLGLADAVLGLADALHHRIVIDLPMDRALVEALVET